MVKISPCEVEEMTVDSFLKMYVVPNDCKIYVIPFARSPNDLFISDTNSFYINEYWGSYYQRKLSLFKIENIALFEDAICLII